MNGRTTAAALHLEGLRKTFRTARGERAAVDGVTATVPAGSFVSVVGPSGCGKSTLLEVVAGLVRPDAGRVLVGDRDVTRRPGACAYMPQEDLLFAWRTVLQNAALGLEVRGVPAREARRRAAELVGPFGLAGFEDARPDELSGGMRQRAALLRTVVQGPGVLLLDEPFGALDALTRLRMQGWLHGMWRQFGWTVLLVTHDVREAVLLSDRVLVLGPRPARVVHDETVDLPHPRDAATRCAALEARLLDRLGGTTGAVPGDTDRAPTTSTRPRRATGPAAAMHRTDRGPRGEDEGRHHGGPEREAT